MLRGGYTEPLYYFGYKNYDAIILYIEQTTSMLCFSAHVGPTHMRHCVILIFSTEKHVMSSLRFQVFNMEFNSSQPRGTPPSKNFFLLAVDRDEIKRDQPSL